MREQMFTIRGLGLCLCEWGPEDGPPVLCLHGVLDQGLIWESVAAPLAGTGYRVMAPDLRGHGKSSHVGAGGSYQLLDFVADIVTLVDQMVERPMVVVGHSLGSVIATVLTGLRSHLVEQLILVEPVLPKAPQPENPLTGINTLIEYVSSPPIHIEMKDIQEAVERLRQALPCLTTDFAERLCRRSTVSSGKGLIWSWDPVLRSRTSLSMQNGPITREAYLNILSDIKQPITTIQGADSTFNRGEDLAALQLVLQHANRNVITGGHNLPVESPVEVVSIILDILALARPKINTIERRI
jgi:pimeloyl-ACP methyl ester carboxylesterase